MESIPAPIAIPPILEDSGRHSDSAANREWMSEKSGFAYKICKAIPNMIMKNQLKFMSPDGTELQDIQARWIASDGNRIWNELMIADRTHGWAIAAETKLDPAFSYNLGKLSTFEVFSASTVPEVERKGDDIIRYFVDYDRNDYSTNSNTKTRNNVGPRSFVLGYDEVLHVESIHKKNHLGVSILSKAWHHILFAEWVSYLTVIFDAYLKPILLWPFPSEAKDSEISAVADKLKDAPIVKMLGVRESTSGSITWPQYVQSSADGQSFESHLQIQLNLIAADAEIPARLLVGSQEGALSSSKEDKLAIQDYLESTFRLYEPFIRYWCEQQGILPRNAAVKILPDISLSMTDEDKKKLELLELEKTKYLERFSTINEMRERNNLPAIAVEAGGKILSIEGGTNTRIETSEEGTETQTSDVR